jgi:hypothetical protein
MSRGGLCQAAPAAPSTPQPGPYGRLACQPATAGGHSRFVDMIPHVSLSSWSSALSEGTPDQSGRTIPKPHGRIDSRSPAGTAAIIA